MRFNLFKIFQNLFNEILIYITIFGLKDPLKESKSAQGGGRRMLFKRILKKDV